MPWSWAKARKGAPVLDGVGVDNRKRHRRDVVTGAFRSQFVWRATMSGSHMSRFIGEVAVPFGVRMMSGFGTSVEGLGRG